MSDDYWSGGFPAFGNNRWGEVIMGKKKKTPAQVLGLEDVESPALMAGRGMAFKVAVNMAARQAHRRGKITRDEFDKIQNFADSASNGEWQDVEDGVVAHAKLRAPGPNGRDWAGLLEFLKGLMPLIMQLIELFSK